MPIDKIKNTLSSDDKLKIGYIGLGKMGLNMTKNAIDHGHEIVATDINEDARKEAADYGAETAESVEGVVEKLDTETKIVWMMVPHGDPVDETVSKLKEHLDEGDIVIDGGNSHYEESQRRSGELAEENIHFFDIGVSGGPDGAREGACMMAGGPESEWERIEPLIRDLCVEDGYGYFGATPNGHFVKMVHNGIEYGMMQAIAEGFDVLKKSEYDIDLEKAAGVYNNGAVIESALIEWLKEGYDEFGEDLEAASGKADESGEGRWTTQVAEELGVPTDVITDALDARLRSQEDPNYQGQIITLLRHKFGNHSLEGA
ncbi:MAG: phosphogluconate dehydrogenase (NAD(+)-dependent, decarboxylating), partial [Candidatus Nanohaloarchaea archaeon]